MTELIQYDWQIIWLARASLAPNSDLYKFVKIICAQNCSRELYEKLIDFYTAKEAYVAIPMLIQRLAQFEPENSEERFAL